MNYKQLSRTVVKYEPSSSSSSRLPVPTPKQCTMDQLLRIRSQLHPQDCITSISSPWLQRCSITKATSCPDSANWLEEYYSELQREYYYSTMTTRGTTISKKPFIGMSVGCNKGFDALNILRMGTFDASLDKNEWRKAMTLNDEKIHTSVCDQDTTLAFAVDSKITQRRDGEVYCFEPMPKTHKKLRESAEILGYDQKGFKVVHAAVSREEGKAFFDGGDNFKTGVENKGLWNGCGSDKDCVAVDILTLEKYTKESVVNGEDDDQPINFLQIDVEGFDMDVILGAGAALLNRVEYMEFEYNWMGSWRSQHLYDLIEMLDNSNNDNFDENGNYNDSEDSLSFTCYWEGNQRLWRITGCWMLYYDVHMWSNIACVNRKRVPRLAEKMEAVFQKTLLEATTNNDDNDETPREVHEILSLDPERMTSKYLSNMKN